ncbi:MAG TPA: class I SAM-dependent methyltransferase [Burkholderiales bacterium]|nr:class I SAM-dependent methyltransferase [Burkholderiales bacterium]
MQFSLARPDEALAESAPLARRLAPRLCRVDPGAGTSCAWNHGLWQTLRLLGLATTPALHAEFFRAALGSLPQQQAPLSLLISGSADYSMLAVALGAVGADAEPTVLDICDTPLMLNRWYAERVGRPIETCRSDIFDYAPARRFDAICTHAFLGMFPSERRPALIAKWRELLRPGGAAITVNRLRPAHAGARVEFDAAQARAFAATARARAAELGDALGVDPDALAREAETYAARQCAYPVRSAPELRALFEGAGFAVARLECAPLAPALRSGVSAPTVPGDAEYAQIVALRR